MIVVLSKAFKPSDLQIALSHFCNMKTANITWANPCSLVLIRTGKHPRSPYFLSHCFMMASLSITPDWKRCSLNILFFMHTHRSDVQWSTLKLSIAWDWLGIEGTQAGKQWVIWIDWVWLMWVGGWSWMWISCRGWMQTKLYVEVFYVC